MTGWGWRGVVGTLAGVGLVSCLTQGEVRELGEGGDAGELKAGGTQHVVCWNIHKAADELFTEEVEGMTAAIPGDEGLLLCLQEARSTTFDFLCGAGMAEMTGHYAPSWRYAFSRRSTGVLTVSRGWGRAGSGLRLPSPNRELWVTSPKVAMLSEWPIAGGGALRVVNCHGLNFVPDGVFERQMKQVVGAVGEAAGPALVCGDFNTWSEERLRRLREQAGEVGLEEVPVPQPGRIPGPKWPRLLAAVSGYEPDLYLDRVFTRGLEVLGCEWWVGPTRSDHMPLVVSFRISK